MRRVPQQQHNAPIRRERDERSFRRQLLLLVSCLALAVGFILATRQQIAAVQYGYKIEALRRERETLLDEQRRLKLALEENSSSARLSRAARDLGLQPAHASQIEAGAQREAGEESAGTSVFVGTATASAAFRH
ncbi:MAG: cell division protein FtsL [Acidobacteria bacterium]|nr:cell division protein FtsL [Acidobacteriota bacterium]